MQKITVRAGSIIVFSAELPHSMFPNESEGFRYAQYLRMAPLSTLELLPENFARRQQMVRQNLPPELEITAIGKEVFLLDEPSL
jgi:ectoine hydroxylase-related dioxygenase (phytanoyl-CoA dioxygenase family)